MSAVKKWRLKVNLEDFFEDERQYCYILIRPEWRIIKDIKVHIKNLFNIKNFNIVSQDFCYLPQYENIEVINEDETIRIISKKKLNTSIDQIKINDSSLANNFVDSSTSHYDDENNLNSQKIKKNTLTSIKTLDDKIPKKVLSLSKNLVELDKSGSNKPYTKKRKSEENPIKIISKVTNCIENINRIPEPSIQLRNKDNSKNKNNLDVCDEEEDVTYRKKRKRKRRKNKTNDSNANEQQQHLVKQNKDESTFIKNANYERNHIRFDGEDKIFSDGDMEKFSEIKPKVIFKNHLDDLTGPRIITGIVAVQPENNASQSIEQINNESESFLNNNDQTVTDNIVVNNVHEEINENNMKNGDETIVTNEELISETYVIPGATIAPKTLNIEEYFKLSQPLDTAIPVSGDLLFFKTFQLNNGEPCLSELIFAKVEKIEESTQFLKLFIIEGNDQLKSADGEFLTTIKMDNDNLEGYVYLKLEDMIDTHVIKMQ